MSEISLINLPQNGTGSVYQILAGRNAVMRLTGLGITPGTVVKKLSSAPFSGPIQIEVRGTRLAIGRGLASKILLKTKLED